MDYFKQRRAYRDLKMYEMRVSASQNNVYRELLDYANDKKLLDKSFRLTNDAVLNLTGLSTNGLVSARNKLQQDGLIEYEKGKRNIEAPTYKIIKLYDELSKSPGNDWVNDRVSERVKNKVPSQVNDRVTNLITNTQQDLTNTQQDHHDDDAPTHVDADDQAPRDNTDFKDLITYYQQNIGVTSPILVQQLQESINDFVEHETSNSEAVEIVKYAIKLTVENGARNWKYTSKILMNWVNSDLYTLDNIKASNNTRHSNNAPTGRSESFSERSEQSAKETGLYF
ncbi:DnaD domain protein [Companilactobacillus jidongensis]|uniref:DnaD domain protein n=1 Tax=Companilactobacillus jidongensis TaxID=2486006 RepID=UPI000F77E772|nr:DnaD domain protein [Companilactobacillus jidongensis]